LVLRAGHRHWTAPLLCRLHPFGRPQLATPLRKDRRCLWFSGAVRACGLAAFLVLGVSVVDCVGAVEYQFVNTLSAPGAGPARAATDEQALPGTIYPATLEGDVRYLASAELEGRGRGTTGNEKARAHIVARLKLAGLTPLFNGSFEQPSYPTGGAEAYAKNVGSYLPSARADAEWIALVAHYDHLGMRHGRIHPGADDNASAVAMLLALGDALGRARPPLRRHVVLLFPDAEEPPDIRTDRMGSTWFWKHPPFPMAKLHCALVFDLMGGAATPAMRAAGLADLVFILGAEASVGLARLARGIPAEPAVEPMFLGLPMVEAYPYLPWRRYARSDYHGLREHGRRPFLFVTTGRSPTYHTGGDTPDTLDYGKLARLTRWVARLLMHAAGDAEELGWADLVADPTTDARALLRLYPAAGDTARSPWLLRRALAADRARVAGLLRTWEGGRAPQAAEYRELQLAALRLQAVILYPPRWWFALW
jgi:peptidase M28-like protein